MFFILPNDRLGTGQLMPGVIMPNLVNADRIKKRFSCPAAVQAVNGTQMGKNLRISSINRKLMDYSTIKKYFS